MMALLYFERKQVSATTACLKLLLRPMIIATVLSMQKRVFRVVLQKWMQLGCAMMATLRCHTFTTVTASEYRDSCSPAYVVLEADSEDFINSGYTFSESEQQEDFIATVYAAVKICIQRTVMLITVVRWGGDGDDDQPIERIDDGLDAGFDWSMLGKTSTTPLRI